MRSCASGRSGGKHVASCGPASPRSGQAQRRIRSPQLEVARHQRTAPGVELLEPLELSQAHRGRDVREVVLAAGQQCVEPVGAGLHLTVPAVQTRSPLSSSGEAARDRATLDGGDVLVGVKAEKPPGPPKLPIRRPRARAEPMGMRGVLDDAQTGCRPATAYSCSMSSGRPAKCTGRMARGARCDRRRYLLEIDVARVEAHVHEHRAGHPRATIDVGGGHEAQRRRDDLIPPGRLPQASSAISRPAVAEVWVRTGRPPQ